MCIRDRLCILENFVDNLPLFHGQKPKMMGIPLTDIFFTVLDLLYIISTRKQSPSFGTFGLG